MPTTILNTDFYIPGGSNNYTPDQLLTIIAKRCMRISDLPYQYLLYDKIYVPISDFSEVIPLIYQFGNGVKDLFESKQIQLIRLQNNFVLFKKGFIEAEKDALEELERNNGLLGTVIEGPQPTTHLDTEAAYYSLQNLELEPKWLKVINENRDLILENTITVGLTDNLHDISENSKKDITNFYDNQTKSNYLGGNPENFWEILSDMMADNNVNYLAPSEVALENKNLPLANIFMNQVIFNSQLALMKKFSIDDIAESEEVKYSLTFGRLLNDTNYYSWIFNKGTPIKSKQNTFLFFQEMTKLPDISKVLVENKGLTKNLMKLKESINGKSFREWFHQNCGSDNKQLTQAYIDLLSCEAKFETTGAKALRFLTTTGVGLIPVIGQVAGAALGAIDTFFLGRLDSSKRPKLFVENIKRDFK